MKHFIILLASIGIVVVFGCSDQRSELSLQYTVTIEDHEATTYQFPSGIYYSYVFPEPQSTDFDVDAVFMQVLERGIQLRDAWYKNYRSSCSSPGSDYVLPAIVEGGFVVRVDRRALELQAIGFVETSNPNVGWCAYAVRHYHFQ
jgi:hypothetical protein